MRRQSRGVGVGSPAYVGQSGCGQALAETAFRMLGTLILASLISWLTAHFWSAISWYLEYEAAFRIGAVVNFIAAFGWVMHTEGAYKGTMNITRKKIVIGWLIFVAAVTILANPLILVIVAASVLIYYGVRLERHEEISLNKVVRSDLKKLFHREQLDGFPARAHSTDGDARTTTEPAPSTQTDDAMPGRRRTALDRQSARRQGPSEHQPVNLEMKRPVDGRSPPANRRGTDRESEGNRLR